MTNVDFNIVFWLILGTFTLGAAVLTTTTLINVIRLRNVRISWNDGKLKGYPLFSTMFLGSVLLVGGIALYRGETEEILASALYGWLGICWFTTSFLATKRFITDHGIVKNVNEPSQTVAWHEIRDFVEKENSGETRYIFLYSRDEHERPRKLVRLELDVPARRRESFKKLISHKLGRRIRCYLDEDINVRQFDRPGN